MEPEEYELFEKYLTDELTAPEKVAFETRINNDPEFAETFHTYKDIQTTLTARESSRAGETALRKNLDTLADEYIDGKTEKTAKVIPLKRAYLWAAASVIIILGTLYIFTQEFGDPSYAQYSHHEPLALATRGQQDSLFMVAENTFNKEDYTTATRALEAIVQKDPENAKAKLYLAIACIETEQYDRAGTLLSEIQKGTSVFQHQATWYLALSYLKQEKKEACRAALKEIPEESDRYTQARELLEKL